MHKLILSPTLSLFILFLLFLSIPASAVQPKRVAMAGRQPAMVTSSVVTRSEIADTAQAPAVTRNTVSVEAFGRGLGNFYTVTVDRKFSNRISAGIGASFVPGSFGALVYGNYSFFGTNYRHAFATAGAGAFLQTPALRAASGVFAVDGVPNLGVGYEWILADRLTVRLTGYLVRFAVPTAGASFGFAF